MVVSSNGVGGTFSSDFTFTTPSGVSTQTITFGALASRTLAQSPFTVSATASSGLPVSFTSGTPAVCTAGGTNGSTITLLSVGTCTIVANQAGNASFSAAPPVSQSFAVTAVPTGAITIDKTVFKDGRGTQTTSAFSTAAAGELLVAFVSADGPVAGGQTATVTGGGLTWTLARRTNTRAGTSEVWVANAPGVLSNATVTSTLSKNTYDQSLTVVAFQGASGIGATASASGASGAPTIGLTTTQAGSWVYGVGNDWDSAIARTLPAGQTMVHQWVDSAVGDTFWAQSTTTATALAGTPVTLNATAPTTDRWNFAAVEILPS